MHFKIYSYWNRQGSTKEDGYCQPWCICDINGIQCKSNQDLVSYDYPNHYTKNIECSHQISVEKGKIIMLEFISFYVSITFLKNSIKVKFQWFFHFFPDCNQPTLLEAIWRRRYWRELHRRIHWKPNSSQRLELSEQNACILFSKFLEGNWYKLLCKDTCYWSC